MLTQIDVAVGRHKVMMGSVTHSFIDYILK